MPPVLYNEHDGADTERIRAADADPYVMYLVAPHRPAGSTGQMLAHAALAVMRCLCTLRGSDQWANAFAGWEAEAFRKVCLRASARELAPVRRLAHTEAGEMVCLPPRRRSAAEPGLARLKAHIGGPLAEDPTARLAVPDGAMVLLICAELGLTAGKACAQVAHAVQIGAELHRGEAVAAWERRGWPVEVGLVDGPGFERAKAELEVAAVRDAGLTQLRPGTETVLAVEPGAELPAWLQEAARGVA